MNDDAMRDLLSIGDEVDLLAVQIEDGASIQQVEETLQKVLRKERNVEKGKEDFSIQTPAQIIETVNNIVGVVQSVLVGIALISLLVGGIGIMNTMYTAVLERTKEIGIMKAIGAQNKDIMLLFLIESGLLGLFGGLIGLGLGIFLSKGVEFVAAHALGPNLLAASISWQLAAGALLFSCTVGIVSGLLPSRQASALAPVEALRK